MSNLIEIYADGISNSISEVYESKLKKAIDAGNEMLNGSASESDYEAFYEVAQYVVEPVINNEDAADAYREFMDNDSDNWQNWIDQNFGSEWGFIVKVVAEQGY